MPGAGDTPDSKTATVEKTPMVAVRIFDSTLSKFPLLERWCFPGQLVNPGRGRGE